MVSDEVLRKVSIYIAALRDKGITISRVFIFGSQARGTATQESDIDVCIISPLFDEDHYKYAPELWGGTERCEFRIEPVAVGQQRFLTDESSPLIAIVREEGVEVRC
jgi:predicted nucleotidyltransferase